MPRIRLRNVVECYGDVPKYNPDHALEMDLKRRQAALLNEHESKRPLDSWAEPPYEFLCPLEFHEVTDLRKWKNIRPTHQLFEGRSGTSHALLIIFGCVGAERETRSRVVLQNRPHRSLRDGI